MRFLILDCDRQVRNQIALWLEDIDGDAEVLEAESAKEALQTALDYSLDGFVVDPLSAGPDRKEGDGIRFLSQIRQMEKYRFAGVLVVTHMEDGFCLMLNHFHCCGYLNKPLDRAAAADCLDYFYDYALFCRIAGSRDRMLYVKRGRGFEFVNLSSVVRISFRSHTTEVFFPDATHSFDARNFGKNLIGDRDSFVFCNRSDAVNMHYMESCDGRNIWLRGGLGRVDVTETGREAIRAFLIRNRYYV